MGNKEIFKKVAETPAKTLDKTIEVGKNVKDTVNKQAPVRKLQEYWNLLGPGLTTGAADDDCSGIATYSQTGAKYGFKFLWLAFFTFPLMAVVQEMCARIGLTTGRGLAANIRAYFPRWLLYLSTLLLFAANTFNIGADLGAMAEAMRLFLPQIGYSYLVIFFAILILILQIFSTYKKYAKYLKYLALVLLSYIFSTLMIKGLNWGEILHYTIRPSMGFGKDEIILICGALGTTISPYLFFWQTSQEVEEQVTDGMTTISDRVNQVDDNDIKEMRIDIWSGMFLSNLVMFFIIAACAATLHINGIYEIGTAAQAAEALRPIAGDSSYVLFAIGIIGVGLLGIPVLAGSSSYAISESFAWKEGLNKKLDQAYAFYGMIIFSVLIGLALNFIGLDPILALIYAAVGNGIVAPLVLVFIVLLSSNAKVMGKRKSGWLTATLGWITVLLMAFAGGATIWSILFR